MKPDDSFLKRLTAINDLPNLVDQSNRFGMINTKTFGFLVVSSPFMTIGPFLGGNVILQNVFCLEQSFTILNN